MKYILGISCYYHDSSAALLKDGRVVAAAQEERFTRKKHDTSFPINAIRYCLRSQKITSQQLDHLAFYEKPLLKLERVLCQHLETFPKSGKTFLSSMPSWINEKTRVLNTTYQKLKYGGDISFIDHHLSHAASFLISPFKDAAILTVDGVGEWATTSYGFGKENQINLLKEIKFPSSLGLLYSTLTAYLGFSVNNSEYKVMGLSAYGNFNPKTNQYYHRLKKVIEIKDDGSYQLDMRYFNFHYADRMINRKLCQLLGAPPRKPESQLTQRDKDIASALQLIYQEALFKILNHLYQVVKLKNLVLSGGCGLNSVANGQIIKETPFENLWSQPDPGDGGTSIGAATYLYHTILNRPRQHFFHNPFVGPTYSMPEIKEFLKKHQIKYTEFKDDQELIKQTGKLIHSNWIVGWFQGRMEWGPRALGARSILANPCNPGAKKLLNEKVKHREKFRPFAPAVCRDDAPRFFDCDQPVPKPTDYMLMVYPVIKKWRNKIPSVTHVNGSARLQTIDRKDNQLYYDLIKEFGRLSGIPILINTSFNVRGEPIVCSPYDAYRCMMGTGIDYLVIGKFLIKRRDNPQHYWDSEKDV
jgi:carbamoyltransferase